MKNSHVPLRCMASAVADGFTHTHYMDEKNNEQAQGEGMSAHGVVYMVCTNTSGSPTHSAKSHGMDPKTSLSTRFEDEFELVMGPLENEKGECLHRVCR